MGSQNVPTPILRRAWQFRIVILENLLMTTNTQSIPCMVEGRPHIVHQDGFPRLVMSRKRGVQGFVLNGWFGNGASDVGPDILGNMLSKFRPIKLIL